MDNNINSYGNFPNLIKRDDTQQQDDSINQFDPKHVKGLGEVNTTLVSLGDQGQTQVKGQYQALANRPTIPNPGQDQVPFNKEAISPQIMQKVVSLKNPLPNDSAMASAFEEQLSLYAQQNNLSQEEVVKLRYAFYNPDATEDPQIKADAQAVANAASQELQQQFNLPNNYQITPNTQGFNDSVAGAYNNAFEAQLAQLAKQQNLTPDQVNQLRYAFYNPGSASPAIQQMLTQLETNAAQIVQQQFGLPAGWKPPQPDNTDFNAKIVAAFDSAFENTLQNQAPPLTDTQKGQLRFMFYNPQTSFPGSEELEQMLHTMELNTLNALKGSLGLPPGVQPQPATQYFNTVLSSAYQVALKDVLAEYLNTIKPPMNKKDQDLLERALENPDDPSIPDEIKQIAAMLQGKAITAVRQRYNLPEVWSPNTVQMQQIPNTPGANMLKNGVNYLNDFTSIAYSTILKMPPGPEKNALIDFLKVINDALTKLKEFLYQMTSMDSAIAKKITQAKMEDQQEKIKFFKEAQDAAQHADGGGKGGGKSQSTQKFLSVFMKVIVPILMVVTFIVTVAIAIATFETGVGPVITLAIGISIMAALTALMIADTQTHCISKFFQAVSDVLEDILPGWLPDPLKDLIDIDVKVAIILAVLLVCCIEPSALVSVGLSFGMQALMDSGVIQEGIAACGGNQEAQAIGAMVVGCVLALTVGAITLIQGGKGFITGIAKVGEEGAEFSSQTAVVSEKVTMEGIKQAETTTATIDESETEEAVLTQTISTTEHMGQEETITLKTQAADATTFKEAIKQIFQDAVENTKDAQTFIDGIATNAKEQFQFLEKLADWAKQGIDKFASLVGNRWAMRGFTAAQLTMDVAAQGAQIQMGLEQMKLHMDLAALALLQANLEAAIVQVEALIKQLTKLIEVFLDGLTQATDWIKNVNQMQNQIWQGASSSMTNLVHATARAA